MYKLFNKLFGWDYIYWKNSADQGIRRVRKACSGEVYYVRYSVLNYIDVIKTPDQVIWLTCKPLKYFSNETTNRAN